MPWPRCGRTTAPRVVANLAENAARFGAEAVIRLRSAADEIAIDIEDDGPGIPNALKQNMEPCVRGDEARKGTKTAGSALWLSISNVIVTAHGGTPSLHDRPSHGLVVRMRLPIHQNGGRAAAWTFASGCERVGISFLVDRDRLEAIVAGAAEPEEGRAALTALDPIRSRDRLATLGTGITARQIAGIESSHGASP